jgi:hypothetical protein
MSSLASSVTYDTFRKDWTSPKQQLKRLHEPVVSVLVNMNFPRAIAEIVSEYQMNSDSVLTGWYRALEKINFLPTKIPPIPQHILDLIFRGNCPIDDKKDDEIHFKIQETHFLVLIPPFMDLQQCLNVFEVYGKKLYKNDKHPFKLKKDNLLPRILQKYADTPFKMHWELVTTSLPNSRNISSEQRIAMINSICKKALQWYGRPLYQMPTLNNIIASIFLLATLDYNLYPIFPSKRGLLNNRVFIEGEKERVGNFTDTGLSVVDIGPDGDNTGLTLIIQ